jgi:serine/threonine-protein kinase
VWTLVALASDIPARATVTRRIVVASEEPFVVGRYLLHRQIARGGMATIHLAHLMGDVGFSRIVAAKRLHPELAENGEFVSMFLDEARVASKVHHRNVVPVLDVVTTGGEVVLVQEYVRGATLAQLLQMASEAKSHVPLPIAASIACQVLAGLHAAHETTDEMGTPLQIVHRDVSPQNIMVATDGTARLLDFGVAKAAMAAHVTRKGTFKGKLGYSAPEHIRGSATRQSDIYSLAVVLWELATGRRLHRASLGITKVIERVMSGSAPKITEALAGERVFISGYRWQQLEAIEPLVTRGLATDPRDRWSTAAEMEESLSVAVPLASGSEIAEWLTTVAKVQLEDSEHMIAELEARWRGRNRQGSPAPQDLAIDVASGPAHALEIARSRQLAAWLGRRANLRLVLAGATMFLLALAITVSWPRDRATAPPAAAPAPANPPSHDVPAPEASFAPPPAENCAPGPTQAAAPSRPSPAPHPPLRTVPKKSPPPAPRISKPTPSPPQQQPPPRETPAAPPPKETARPSRPANECNPPYYFDGAKKVFKPACV